MSLKEKGLTGAVKNLSEARIPCYRSESVFAEGCRLDMTMNDVIYFAVVLISCAVLIVIALWGSPHGTKSKDDQNFWWFH